MKIQLNTKSQVLSMTSLNCKQTQLVRNVKWQNLLNGQFINMILPQWNMKMQAKLAESKDQFTLFLNGEDIFSYKRYAEESKEDETNNEG